MLAAVRYCQSCGAQNDEAARYCNMCGVAIATPGRPGGPVAGTMLGAGAPPAVQRPVPRHGVHHDTTSISLAGIGVRTVGSRAWWYVAGFALACMAIGGSVTLLATGSEEAPPVSPPSTGAAAEDDPLVIGTPLPRGVDPASLGAEAVGDADASQDEASRGSSRRAATRSRTNRSRRQTRTSSAMAEPADTSPAPADAPAAMDAVETPASGQELELYAARVSFAIGRYHRADVDACLATATRAEPSLHGTVVVRATVASDGQVRQTQVVRDSTGSPNLGSCLASRVRSWRLPPPPGGELEWDLPFSR